ncbi:LemA family protein [Flagellimonas abyssi]|uniref:LemA family protein n=1 Tax=Flagellimonas abyssi TaxID=2864871 RepID=A0ABS7ESK1_9FLAO|nr:LemA family protein [Allomuricauda abyssi]MBW8200586.1 LemA family protein [Allomuricauda abyssi]|tara:strand:+ start:150 stop:701 length:552 start_codon:yes stop_codon:yes gene_type:complete
MSYFILIIVLILLFCVFLYNNLISKKNKVEESYSTIDVMLKKRTDLIPQLVTTVKGSIQHERETLTELTRLREKILDKEVGTEERFQLESQLGIMLGKLQVRAEAYPDLKANQNFLLLQSSLNEVEEQLSAARRAYNAAVNSFNNAIEMFPSNLMGKMMGYQQRTLFIIKEEERSVPKISFNS